MKRLVFFSLVAVFSLIIYAVTACAPKNDKDGIRFIEGSLQEALNKAKAEQKPVFIDIYATWCGPCKMLKKRTFSNKDVGSYFNAHFINLSLDGEKGDGAALANKYQIPGYPTLIVLNKDGGMVTMQTGYVGADELLDWGKQVLGR